MKLIFKFVLILSVCLVLASITLAGELESDLMNAAINGNADTVRTLIEKGADVNTRAKDGSTALISAANNCHMEVVKLLIEKGGNVNVYDKTGRTALMKAADHGCMDTIRFLIEKGADINAKDDYEGKTALMWAVGGFIGGYGNVNVVRLLIEKGADVNAKNKYGSSVLDQTDIFPDPDNKGQDARLKEISQILRKAGAR